MTQLLNRNFLPKALFTILLVAFSYNRTLAQIFPEVNNPEQQKIKAREEKEKLARSYYNDQQYDKAADLYKGLFDENPSNLNYTYYFYCLTALGEYDEAEKVVRTMIKSSKRSVRYKVDQGYIYQLQDKYEKANHTYDDIVNSLDPKIGDIQETANAFISRHLFDYAVKTYSRGRELLGNRISFHNELARVYEITGDYEKMINEYLDLLQEDPTKMSYVQGRLQNTLAKDNDDSISEILRKALLKKSQSNPEDRNLSQMLFWLSVQRKDFDFALVQAISIDKRYGEDGAQVFRLGRLALSDGDYDAAAKSFQYILDLGPDNPYYLESLTGNLKARFKRITSGMITDNKEFSSLENEYIKAFNAFGYNPRTIFMMRDLAHLQAFYMGKIDDAIDLLDRAVDMPGVNQNVIGQCKLELGDILLYKGNVWDASLLYSQVDKALKNDPLGSEAKLRNARLSYYIGEFDWARAQLDVLKAATSKLVANDAMELSLLISDNIDPDSSYTGLHYYAHADLLSYMNRDTAALQSLDSIRMLGLYHPLDDEVLYKKAEIYIKLKRYQDADSLLAKVVTDYGNDILADNALFTRAKLQETIFRNKDTAMALYEKILTDYSGSLFVTEARKRFRILRGDQLPDSDDNTTPYP